MAGLDPAIFFGGHERDARGKPRMMILSDPYSRIHFGLFPTWA